MRPTVHGDNRGFFLETYRRDAYAELGIADEFVQDNHSLSRRGIVRGMHFQPGQSKLVRCARGSVLDVIVDIRRGSPTFGEWEAVELDAERHLPALRPGRVRARLLRPERRGRPDVQGLDLLRPAAESGFRYDDPEVGIEWPDGELTPSERDANAPRLAEIADELPFSYEG